MTQQNDFSLAHGQSPHGQQSPNTRKPLSLYFEILGMRALRDADFVDLLLAKAKKYGVTELNIHGGTAPAIAAVNVPGFPKVDHPIDEIALAEVRAILAQFKEHGLSVTLSAAEPCFPEDFFTAYPEAHNISNKLAWYFLEERTRQIFRTIPEVDCIQFHLWESDFMADQVLFRDFWFAGDGTNSWDQYQQANQYYSLADYITELMAAFSRAAAGEGKAFSLLTFCHYPWQEKVVIEALQHLDRRFPIVLDHKCQPGDWAPFRPANNVMLEITDRGPAKMKFDGVGEYWGQGHIPYCYPDEIQARVLHALAHNASIDSLGMRVHWESGHLFGKCCEINFYALARLAQNPDVHMEDVWRDWASERFGEVAAPGVVSALQRTNQIANLSYYMKGVRAQMHSHIADLGYFLSQLLKTGRAQLGWMPWNIRDNHFIHELLEDPREHTIQVVLDDRREALRLLTLSLADIDATRANLRDEDYARLHQELTLQQRFVEMSILHVEACLRYWIQRKSPANENLQYIEHPLQGLRALADALDSGTQPPHPLFTSDKIRALITEIRDSLAALPALEDSY